MSVAKPLIVGTYFWDVGLIIRMFIQRVKGTSLQSGGSATLSNSVFYKMK